MKEPCRSCQAYMLAGDPAAADPVCTKSPHHHVVEEAVARAQLPDSERIGCQPMIFRDPKESRRLSCKG